MLRKNVPLFKTFALNCDEFSTETELRIVYMVGGEVGGLVQTMQVKFALLNHRNTSQIWKSWTSWDTFTVMLPRIVIDLFLNNQPDPPIIQIYSVTKLYMFGHPLCPLSGILYCTFGTGKFHAGFDDSFQA
jgi:hypothetical protein